MMEAILVCHGLCFLDILVASHLLQSLATLPPANKLQTFFPTSPTITIPLIGNEILYFIYSAVFFTCLKFTNADMLLL